MNHRSAVWARPVAASLLVLAPTACSGSQPGYRAVVGADLDTAAQQKLVRAAEARDALAGRLMAELRAALADGGPDRGIAVCLDRAPAIAREVFERHPGMPLKLSLHDALPILRNSDNRAPAWASAAVAERRSSPATFVGGAGQVAALYPILLQPQCVQCHGNADELAPPVAAALRDAYPEDRATGFAPGDLRGWFWVEVE